MTHVRPSAHTGPRAPADDTIIMGGNDVGCVFGNYVTIHIKEHIVAACILLLLLVMISNGQNMNEAN